MDRRIIYLSSYPAHLPYFICSVHTLRDYWDGPIDLFAWDQSLHIANRIAQDGRLNVNVVRWKPEFMGHSDTYVDKTRLIQSMNSDVTALFLDADTTIHGSLSPLFDLAEKHGFVATQFNDWRSNGKMISNRIRSLSGFKDIDAELIRRASIESWPSVNSGIFAAMPTSPVLPLWHMWTKNARATFIPDEKVLHLMMLVYAPGGEFAVAAGGRWNCSPKLQPKDLPDSQVVIRHFHGHSNVRPRKSHRGWALWKPVFDRCCELNLGGVAEWYCKVGNKWIKELIEDGKL